MMFIVSYMKLSTGGQTPIVAQVQSLAWLTQTQSQVAWQQALSPLS